MTAVAPSVDVFRVHSPAARAPANASTFAVTIVIGTPSAIKLGVNWPVKLNAMASGLRPAAVRVLPLGLETALNSSKSCTIPPGGTQQAPSSSLMWRQLGHQIAGCQRFDDPAANCWETVECHGFGLYHIFSDTPGAIDRSTSDWFSRGQSLDCHPTSAPAYNQGRILDVSPERRKHFESAARAGNSWDLGQGDHLDNAKI